MRKGKRRQFEQAFKVEAVRLVTEEERPVASVDCKLDIKGTCCIIGKIA